MNSVSGRNTQALQVFLSPLALLSRLCPQHRCLFSGFCWYASVSLCCVGSKCSVFIAEVSTPHTIPGIRSLDPTSLLGFNTLTLTVRLSQVCQVIHSLVYTCLETNGFRVGSSKGTLSDAGWSLSLREERWWSQDIPLPSQAYLSTTLPLVWLPM